MLEMQHPVVDIAVICSDFEEALRFYRDALGLEVTLDLQIPTSTARPAGLAPTGFRQVRLRCGQTLIKLVHLEPAPTERSHDIQAGVRWLTLILKDVPAAVQQLKDNGVEFLSEPVSAPDAKHVVCAKGPDGVLIELVQLPD